MYYCIQLFRQRLPQKSVKVYATMPIGIMSSKSLTLLDWGLRRFSNKEWERMKTCGFFCCFLTPRWNTLRFAQATVKTTITHNSFRHCHISFSPLVRQPFSKQLYVCCHFVYTYFLDFTARRFFLLFLRSSSESSPPAWLSAKATILVSPTAGSEPYSSVSVSDTWSSITGSWKSNIYM